MKDKSEISLPLPLCQESFTNIFNNNNIMNIKNMIEHATNVVNNSIPPRPEDTIPAPPGAQLTQNRSGATAPAGTTTSTTSTNNSPNSPTSKMTNLDYIFQYSYLLSFIGAILYCVLSLLNIDPSSIYANKTTSIIINVIISLSGVYSLFRWFNTDIPYVEPTYITRQNIKIVSN